MSTVPSIQQQKAFILANSQYLDIATSKSILNVAMLEVGLDVFVGGRAPPPPPGQRRPDASIELDRLPPDVLLHIYNMVYARRTELDRPVTN